MFIFPRNLYTDVRIEEVFETKIFYTMENLDENKTRHYKAAFIRVFDGIKWYYSSTTDISNIQKEIDNLASLATPNENIYDHPVIKKLEANSGNFITFTDNDISKVPKERKLSLLLPYFKYIKNPFIKMYSFKYIDERKVKNIYSSKGSNLTFDSQRAGFSLRFNMADGEKQLTDAFQRSSCYFNELLNKEDEFVEYIKLCENYLYEAKSVIPGKYTVILSPEAAGVFAHESFGHKSEADFMLGDETMKKEWALGSKIAPEHLSIVDDGNEISSGYVPFDDEGTRARKTFLIQNGILKGRLHSAVTASSLEEDVTGNGRAINFEFEPIVRMTCTYIMPGNKTKEQLISEVEEGILVETIKHGSGMSTFTLAPNRSYYIRNGKIAEPVNVSVITGSVFDTLSEIDGLSDKLQIISFVTGGCGKMEQFPLPVGFGGPYVRVKNMNVQ